MPDPIRLTRDQLSPLLPHAGSMLMIDSVIAFDETSITCGSERHQAANNPLRREGRLAAHHGIEFAAQASAIHGGLLGGGGQAPLRALAAVRKASFAGAWLDEIEGQLRIDASIVMLDANAAVYQAILSSSEKNVAAMRLTLMTINEEISA